MANNDYSQPVPYFPPRDLAKEDARQQSFEVPAGPKPTEQDKKRGLIERNTHGDKR